MENVNISAFYLFNQFTNQSLVVDSWIIFFADHLAYILVAVFILIAILSKVTKAEKMKIGLGGLLSVIIGRVFFVESIRFFYNHPRPFVTLSNVRQLFPETGYSFPSGHATIFFGLSAVVYCFNKKAGVAFFILSAIMGIARIMAGVHYPFDILGGAILGTLVGFSSYRLATNLINKKLAAL